MKVRLCETVSVDVETDVNVDVNEVLMEFSRRFEEAELNQECPVRYAFLPLMGFATRLMARVPEAAMRRCNDAEMAQVIRRLRAEAERWATVYVTGDNDQ
jgi:hypothetical protein